MRSSGSSTTPASLRRRGPRSFAARARRAERRVQEPNAHDDLPRGDGPCEAGSQSPFEFETLTLMHVNIRGLKTHLAELDGRLRGMPERPLLVALTETWLDASTAGVCLTGYSVVSRRDRADGRQGGGVALLAASAFADNVVFTAHSDGHERSWHIVHTSCGPLSFCVWYRPPSDELTSIWTFETELTTHSETTIGSIVVGDFNVHNARWLHHSAGISQEGRILEQVCATQGLQQHVRGPTRGDYLLDLVLSDVSVHVDVTVLPPIADHCVVFAELRVPVLTYAAVQRECWQYARADWQAFRKELADTEWGFIDRVCTSTGAEQLTAMILDMARRHIPIIEVRERPSTHPWLTDKCVEAVARKQAAYGSPEYPAEIQRCSDTLRNEYLAFVGRMRGKMRHTRRGTKAFWRLCRRLAGTTARENVPALRRPDGTWAMDPKGKADALAEHFSSKWVLPAASHNEFSNIDAAATASASGFLLLRRRGARRELETLRADSGCGPDLLPTRILKACASELSVPFVKLARRIVATGTWPSFWLLHWVSPLHKRSGRSELKNYRGIQLTAQMSKAMERFLGKLFLPTLHASLAFGPRQFAYAPGRGARDALLTVVLTWLFAFATGNKIVLYCSDVAGAFDKVSTARLCSKLATIGIHPSLLAVLHSWLRPRTASVIVQGATSAALRMQDMVFQGTVWGPPLWNVFYADARIAIQSADFEEVVYADDLNAYRAIPNHVPLDAALTQAAECQSSLHNWGQANQVVFDPTKESFHVLSRTQSHGDNFSLLGVEFDVQLLMHDAVHQCAIEAGWRVRSLLRARKFFSVAEAVMMFKSQVLSYIESRTAGIAHASSTALAPLDNVQKHFLRQLGITDIEAATVHRLIPLSSRRDVAMLGVIHRSGLGRGPPSVSVFFPPGRIPERRTRVTRCHSKPVADFTEFLPQDYIARSALGYAPVYNLLPERIVQATCVKQFQCLLQRLVIDRAAGGAADWQCTLSSRVSLCTHPLRSCG